MKLQNKITSMLGIAALGIVALSSCEGSELYSVNAPDWLASRIDSIAEEKKKDKPEELELMEDYYTFGKVDFSSGWWADFSKYYQIPENEKLQVQFNLNINPAATNTYKNFAMIISNDVDRGGAGYAEYGAIRYDNQPSGNSEWGDYIDRSAVESTLTFATDTDPGVDKLGGKVTVTVDRSQAGKFYVEMNNGTVVKKYNGAALPNINPEDVNTNNIRVFFVVEGSYINFLGTNIEPIGGCTSKEDKQPLSMTLNNVPDQALQSVPLEEAFASMTATVQFEQGVSATIEAKDLIFKAIPDYETLGRKTLIVMYNKTFKGENANEPVIATAEFELVDKLSEPTTIVAYPEPVILGLEDNTTPWWQYFTENIKVERRQTVVVNFTNYSSCLNNWNNFCIILNGEALNEYAVVRADNYGWGDGYGACSHNIEEGRDWDAWRAAMDGAKVTVSITNNSNGTADIKATMIGNDGNTYTQEYIGINTIDKDDLYFRFVCDGNHLVFATEDDYTETVYLTPKVLGSEDNTTAWWTVFTDNKKIEPFHTHIINFTNYTNGLTNWNNFCIVLNAEDVAKEYAVVRADDFGWGDGFAACKKSGGQADWEAWLAAMNGAECQVSITNNGNGTADIIAIMVGNDGETYLQSYEGINTIDPNNLYYRFVCEGSHLVFEQAAKSRRNK